MGKNLYVGNLSYETREAKLRELFEQVGTVESVSIITDRDTGRSKGYGFVEMSTEEEARTAINTLNGQSLDGRPIRIDEARPRGDRSRQRGGRRRY